MKTPSTALLAAVLAAGRLAAVDVSWDGGGSPDADGLWSVPGNWSADSLPTTNEVAILPAVASGQRTVTQDVSGGAAAHALRFVQSGAAGTNRLHLAGGLALTRASREAATPDSSASALQASLSAGASHEHIGLDLNGHALTFPTSGSAATTGGNVVGLVRFNAPGSSIHATTTGHTAFNVFGRLHVDANARLGRDSGTANATGNGAVKIMAGASLAISGSTFLFELAGKRGQDRVFTVSNAGDISVAAGATLGQRWTALPSSTNRGGIVFENQPGGTLVLAGTLDFRVHHAPGGSPSTLDLRNAGLWIVSGPNASVRRLTTSQDAGYIVLPAFTNQVSGILRGSSSDDVIEFDEDVSDGTRRMPVMNHGCVAPGSGTQGSGLASVGTLRLRDIDVAMSPSARLDMDIGGSAPGLHDHLALEAGTAGPAGAGTLDLSGNGTLQLHTVDGFVPSAPFRVTLVAAGTVAGEFATVTLDGEAFTGNRLQVAAGGTYVLAYTGASVDLGFEPPSSPSTVFTAR